MMVAKPENWVKDIAGAGIYSNGLFSFETQFSTFSGLNL